jgi:hypothetical protein
MEAKAKDILKGELKRRGYSYARLAELIGDTEMNLSKKISRGAFSADWFIDVLRKIGAKNIQID